MADRGDKDQYGTPPCQVGRQPAGLIPGPAAGSGTTIALETGVWRDATRVCKRPEMPRGLSGDA